MYSMGTGSSPKRSRLKDKSQRILWEGDLMGEAWWDEVAKFHLRTPYGTRITTDNGTEFSKHKNIAKLHLVLESTL